MERLKRAETFPQEQTLRQQNKLVLMDEQQYADDQTNQTSLLSKKNVSTEYPAC